MSALRGCGASIGKQSFIRYKSFITNPRFIVLGDRTKVGPFCRFFLNAQLIIGDDVEIGAGLVVHTAEHIMSDGNKPLAKQGANYQIIKIDSDVYIGSNVTLLPGITIESRTVVGAGAVVTSDLESGFVYGGVPAKPLRPL